MSIGLIINMIVGILLYALAIWLVSKLNLGLKVSGFVPALIAAVVIAVASWLIIWLLGLFGSRTRRLYRCSDPFDHRRTGVDVCWKYG